MVARACAAVTEEGTTTGGVLAGGAEKVWSTYSQPSRTVPTIPAGTGTISAATSGAMRSESWRAAKAAGGSYRRWTAPPRIWA